MDTKDNNTEEALFDISTIEAEDTAEMVVLTAAGKPTNWIWTFAGPGHPKAVELSKKLTRDRLHKEELQEQARVNGKKWKAETSTPEDVSKKNAEYVAARLIGWSPVKFDGVLYPFSVDNAMKLLLDPRKGTLAVQALEFITEQASFTKRSEMSS